MKLGNGKWEHTNFNNRLQPTQIGLGTSGTDSSVMKLDYGYGTTSNNGNVMSQIITAPSLTVNQCYGYDSLNRLTSAEEKSGGTACAGTQQWKQAFTYDRFGNRNFNLADTTPNVLGPNQNPTINQSTNRIAAGQTFGYDFAGNLTSDPATNTNGIVYDAENRQTQYTKSGQATNSYYYDGDGHRIKKIDSTGTTVFVYDAGGQLIAEYTAGNPSSGGTSYLTSDHLGSTRLVIKSDGTTTRHDYLPFGEEIQAGIGGRTTGQGYVADGVRQKFTQKERDNESGLDYFLARYYSSAQGRFLSTDPVRGSTRTPQTWNLYVYVLNSPLRFIDPTGMWHYDETEIDGKKYKIAVGDYDNEYLKGAGYWNAKTRDWGKYHDWTPGLSSFSLGVFGELDRRRNASMQAIGAFAGGTALVGSGAGAGVFLSGGAFGAGATTLGLSGGGELVGLTGYGATTVATLNSLASSGGPTVEVVTNLTQAPAAGQALSTATGNGATALANSFARSGGQLFRAEIPKALLRELERVGLVEKFTHASGALEIKFLPQATRFITQFFK